jgi:CRISPR system Cascade subunit CasA
MIASYCLLHDHWLPLRRLSGCVERVRPADLVADYSDNPFVAPAWGRADFDAATLEFLIGLLATAYAPETRGAWARRYARPPSVEELEAAFAPFAAAYQLLGEGARFAQDLDALADQEEVPVSALLIESPGANTIKENKDLFQKRGQVPVLSRAAAAMALFTLQTYAPSGGAGHRTSMRGGGPLTSLLLPPEVSDTPVTLWQRCWLNTPLADEAEVLAIEVPHLVFPWLAPTITSEGKTPRRVTPDGSHRLQAFWGLPRRIRLSVKANEAGLSCPITGLVDDVAITGYRTRPYGVSYEAFEHPLSPHYKAKASDAGFLPVHPQPGGLSYRDWPDLALYANPMRVPALAIVEGIRRLNSLDLQRYDQRPRLSATGYDMDNMKARGFLEATMPVFLPPEAVRSQFEKMAINIVDASTLVALLTLSNIRQAVAGEHADPQASRFQSLRERFFEATEAPFYALLGDLERDFAGLTAESDFPAVHAAFGARWLATLRRAALDLFAEQAPVEAMPDRTVERVMVARRSLTSLFGGYGKMGAELFNALGLPPPDVDKPRTTRKARSTA